MFWEEKSGMFAWNCEAMRGGQDEFIDMQGGDNKIKRDRNTAGC